jgi:hypothetical protein
LERYCQNPLENSIKWWAKPGRNSTEGLEWLKENLNYKIGHLDNIALYVFGASINSMFDVS